MIGEAYRFKGQASNAMKAYNDALKIDPNFGAPYLGLARARLLTNPDFKAESCLMMPLSVTRILVKYILSVRVTLFSIMIPKLPL